MYPNINDGAFILRLQSYKVSYFLQRLGHGFPGVVVALSHGWCFKYG